MRIATTLAMLGAIVSLPLTASDFSTSQRIPDDERDTAQRAARMFEAERYDEAAGLYRVIIQQHPDCLFAWDQLGDVRFQQGQFAEARKAFAHAIVLNPKDAAAMENLGTSEYRCGDYISAVKHLQAAIALDPDDSAAYSYLSFVYIKLGEADAARVAADKGEAIRRKRTIRSLQDAEPNDKVVHSS